MKNPVAVSKEHVIVTTARLICLACLLSAGAVSADPAIELVENAIEASLADVTMPGSTAGTVIIGCTACEPRSLRVSPDTRYFIGETVLSLADFSREVDRIKASSPGATVVGVFSDTESGRVTRIKVFINQ